MEAEGPLPPDSDDDDDDEHEEEEREEVERRVFRPVGHAAAVPLPARVFVDDDDEDLL